MTEEDLQVTNKHQDPFIESLYREIRRLDELVRDLRYDNKALVDAMVKLSGSINKMTDRLD